MEDIKARYRNKLKKIIIEAWNGEKWIYVKTLSDPMKEFKQECLDKVSLITGEKKEKTSKKFSYEILNEQQNKDASEDIFKKAKEAQDKVMKDILG